VNQYTVAYIFSIMKNIIKSLPLIVVFYLMHSNSMGQTVNCSEIYERALKLYNYGMADSALNILKPCIENKKEMDKVSKEKAGDIFRLAALSSIMNGDPAKAGEYVKQLLKYQPDYKSTPREDDLMEFRMMVNKTYSQPSLRLGVTGGINFPLVTVQKKYSDYPLSYGVGYSLGKRIGYQFGIGGEKTLTKNISLEMEAQLTQILFTYTVNSLYSSKNQYNQSIRYAEIPVIVRYYFKGGSVKPYLEGGAVGRISLNKIEKSDVYGRYWFTNSSNSDKILTTFLTDFEQVGLVLGGGLGYDMKKINLTLDFRYNHSFKSSGEVSKFDNVAGFGDITPDEKFHYTDDINLINMKNIQISIGVLYNLSYKVF
jgi:opacity protein-like surface antigen